MDDKNEVVVMKRNLGLDFLKVLCMFGIVWIHAGTYGAYSEVSPSPNIWVLRWKYMLAVVVNIFAFISGWYGVNFSTKKFFKFIGLSVICGIEAFLVSSKVFNCASFDLWTLIFYCATNWYFLGYLILLLLSPLINAGLEKIKKDNVWSYVPPLGILYIWQFLSSIFPETHRSGLVRAYFSRYSFLTIIMIYIIGRLIRKFNVLDSIKTKWLIIVGICVSFLSAFPPFHYYTAPNLLLEAICFFEIFRRMKVPSWLGKISSFMVPSLFPILLLHRVNEFCQAIFIPLEENVFGNIIPFVSVFISALIVFYNKPQI